MALATRVIKHTFAVCAYLVAYSVQYSTAPDCENKHHALFAREQIQIRRIHMSILHYACFVRMGLLIDASPLPRGLF